MPADRWPWAALPPSTFDGRCLDLTDGADTLRFADLADEVVSLDLSGERPREPGNRPDGGCADAVVPVRGDERCPPFSEASFDTVVASPADGRALADHVRVLDRYLAREGTLLLALPGWPEALRRAIDGDLTEVLPTARRSRASRYRAVLRAAGFEHVRLYAAFPTLSSPTFVFESSRGDLLRWILEESHEFQAPRWRAVAAAVGALDRLSVLEDCFPGYLAVCSRSPVEERSADDRIHVQGRDRTVTLTLRDGAVQWIEKRPADDATVDAVTHEYELLSRLRAADHPIGETLPEGRLRTTERGPVYCERPATGSVLARRLASLSVREALAVGLDWLVEFQRAYRGPAVERTAAEIRQDLTFEPAGIRPDVVPDSVRTFEAPIHGDFAPQNLYVDARDRVETVIDWEYGALRGNPAVDAGFYVVRVLRQLAGGFEEGLRRGFAPGGRHAPVVREAVRSYCDAVDLDPEAVAAYLPAAYVRRLRLHHEPGAAHPATEVAARRERRVRLLRQYREEIRATLCD